MIEKKNERLRGSLDECFNSGLITMYQMMKGFERVSESLDGLALDVPDMRNNSQIFTLRELSFASFSNALQLKYQLARILAYIIGLIWRLCSWSCYISSRLSDQTNEADLTDFIRLLSPVLEFIFH
ncbi:hypothetical protein NC651_005396 [Populus alba x Populus x berolinensis]|nr:hypothetical protein NC651_005396 [Populus alba x Populus x berolinensis]